MLKTGTTTLSCTIPLDLGKKLNLIAEIEERSKSYYVKKALQSYLENRLEDLLLSEVGKEAYEDHIKSGSGSIDYDLIRKEMGFTK